VRLDRRLAHDQLGGDLGVRQPARDELEDLELARGQLVEALRRLRRRRRRRGELLDQPLRDRRGEQRLALSDDADARRELLRRDVLEQEAAGAGAQRLVDVLVQVECGEHQHPDRRRAVERDDAARRLDPVELRHADVHQHDVRRQPPGQLDRLGAVGGLADDVEVVLGVEDHLEAGAHERPVVGDQDAHDTGACRRSRISSYARRRVRISAHGLVPAVSAASSSPSSGSST
jgi:hypothetical protein